MIKKIVTPHWMGIFSMFFVAILFAECAVGSDGNREELRTFHGLRATKDDDPKNLLELCPPFVTGWDLDSIDIHGTYLEQLGIKFTICNSNVGVYEFLHTTSLDSVFVYNLQDDDPVVMGVYETKKKGNEGEAKGKVTLTSGTESRAKLIAELEKRGYRASLKIPHSELHKD